MREDVLVQRIGNVLVLSLNGNCNTCTVTKLDEKYREAMFRKVRHILVDCTYLLSLDFAAMRYLLGKTCEAKSKGISLVLYALNNSQANQIRNKKLGQVLQIKNTFLEAYQHCKANESSVRRYSDVYFKD